MKIYFEDGPLGETADLPELSCDCISAEFGISNNIEDLDYYKSARPSAVIYTNSIAAFDNRYAWNETLRAPEIYIRAGEHMTFTRIDKLTERELRQAHNLGKMYLAGEFSRNLEEI
ncbi:MAG: hypothetical protein J6S14_15495 [Clostridia bacterium]|nr:hypothetical protein [Clostridia bacterium]